MVHLLFAGIVALAGNVLVTFGVQLVSRVISDGGQSLDYWRLAS